MLKETIICLYDTYENIPQNSQNFIEAIYEKKGSESKETKEFIGNNLVSLRSASLPAGAVSAAP